MNATDILNLSFLNSSIASPATSISKLAAGQPVTVNITFPPPLTTLIPSITTTVPGTGVGSTATETTSEAVVTPVFSAGLTWTITAAWAVSGIELPLVEGEDYLILSDGGLAAESLTLVFKPTRQTDPEKIVSITATAVVTALDVPTKTAVSDSKPFTIKYKVLAFDPYPPGHPPLTDADTYGTLVPRVVKELYIGIPQSIVNPGEMVTARILTRKISAQPQLVTSLLDEIPSVDIRGSIPLDNILNFILEPFRKVTSVIPGGNLLSKADDVTANIKKLLPSALTVPVKLDISGQKLTTAYSPIGNRMPLRFTQTPDDAGEIQGFLPLGQWPVPFSIPNTPGARSGNSAGIDWYIDYTTDGTPQGAPLPYVQQSTAFGLLRNILFFPQVQVLGKPNIAPGKAVITAIPFIKIFDIPIAPPDSSVQLPDVYLDILPLPLPEVFAAFENALATVNLNPGAATLCVSRETGYFIGSLDELLQLLGNLSGVLDSLISILATAVESVPAIPELINLSYLNQSIKIMGEALARSLDSGASIDFLVADESNQAKVSDTGKTMKSFIALSPRRTIVDGGTISKSVTESTSAETNSLLTVSPRQQDPGARFYSSYIRDMDKKSFANVTVVPKGSTVGGETDYDTYYDGRLHSVTFMD